MTSIGFHDPTGHEPSAQILVEKPGWLTTVQDGGRLGWQAFGVPVSGPMDRWSHAAANRLVGNPDDEAALEMTVKGPELLFERDTVAAVTGADLSPTVDGRELPLWTTVLLRAGSRLRFGARRMGARSYLAVAGGLDVPVVWGSRATHVAGKIGGMKGRALAAGDRLGLRPPGRASRMIVGRTVPAPARPSWQSPAWLRVVPGPHGDAFDPAVLDVLTGGTYTLSSRSDRMGARLMGPRLRHRGAPDGISEGTVLGALQVPADEQPILLLADRQTVGGYPQVAVVIAADWSAAGQLMPGDVVRFRLTTPAEAQAAGLAHWRRLDEVVPPVRGDAR